ncbi:SPOR domain-containing protein [Aestuariivirga sp.]|uniref:SPOR domain-containing protein n=1 Tax=Aestuariivirga sp. TaxID=2650926 RepID=UPI0025B7E3DB|nr:SPOR domain-containing protein [Aestuariivirga sp.]MCA3556528.1 SPOR domain-containing protein [Aestuariivirga sp.]
MDQDSSNGAGPDKRNWRERLGIGAKDLPKLSDEFRGQPPIAAPPPAGTARPAAPRAPVAKPAPMAPRVPPKPAQPAAEASAAPAVPPPVSRATPKAPDNAAQDALAEKLRAQRAAAERLAEQRVQAARNLTDAKKPVSAPPPPRPAAPPRLAAPVPRSPGVKSPPGGAPRPKFSFADETRADAPRSGLTPPLTPPRPALGGERSPPPFLRPGTGAGANGSIGARPQPAFRPSGAGGGASYGAPPRLQPPATPRAGLGSDPAGYSTARRTPALRSPAPAPYLPAPAPEPRNFPEDEFDDEARTAPRLGRPAPEARDHDDFDEVFEDDQTPARGRASARDFQSAYEEAEEGFADEPRRSNAPLLLGLALLVAGLLMAALIWFYSGDLKNLVNTGASNPSATPPVVEAPATPAKVAAPEASSSGDAQTGAPAARKKQIYDRIVGEQEVTGEMQPTEETPVPPPAAQPDAGAVPASQVPQIEPQGTTNQIPAPDAPSLGATGQGLPDPEPPPPLPIPGSDQQGSLGLKTGEQVAAASAKPDQVAASQGTSSLVTANQAAADQGGMAAPPPTPVSPAQTASSDQMTLPPPEKTTDGAALVSGAGAAAASAANSGSGAAPNAAAAAMPAPDTEITPPAPPAEAAPAPPPLPAAKKTAAKKTTSKPVAKQTDFNSLGSKPVVLVPPSQQGGGSQLAPAEPVVAAPAPADIAAQATAPAAQKRKTIFDLFNGGGLANGIPAQQAAPTEVASAATQTKQATAPAAPAPQAATGGGYVVQLTSFRTEGEAKQEFSRLAGAYPGVVGPLKSQIRQTTVGGSTRFQLALGPLPTRGDATKVCGELIAAGESDCMVRGP